MYSLSKHKSGVTLVTCNLPARESVSVGVWVRVGSRNETNRNSGVSHFLEHILFKGTTKRSTRQIKEAIEGVGGSLNAFTGEESTCYLVKIPKKYMPLALDVLVDMVKNPLLSPREIERERHVIIEEIKMYKDLPSQHVHDEITDLMWPNHPLGRNIAGTEASVSALSPQHLKKHLNSYYHANNIVISVCGNIRQSDVKYEIDRLFPRREVKRSSACKKVTRKAAKPTLKFITKNIEQTHLVLGFRGVSRFSSQRYALVLLDILLGANMSSRLFEEVREKRGLAYEIKTHTNFLSDTGAFSISAGVETKKVAATVKVVLAELKKVIKQRIPEKEFQRAKDYFVGQLGLALEDTMDHMLWLGDRALWRNELPDRNKIIKTVENIRESDVRKVAQSIFKNSNLHFAAIGPFNDVIQTKIKKAFKF